MTLDYKVMEGSLYNTPPCWSIYVCGLVFKHLLAAGGLEGVKANNDAKAKLVCSPFFHSSITSERSKSIQRTIRVALLHSASFAAIRHVQRTQKSSPRWCLRQSVGHWVLWLSLGVCLCEHLSCRPGGKIGSSALPAV